MKQKVVEVFLPQVESVLICILLVAFVFHQVYPLVGASLRSPPCEVDALVLFAKIFLGLNCGVRIVFRW